MSSEFNFASIHAHREGGMAVKLGSVDSLVRPPMQMIAQMIWIALFSVALAGPASACSCVPGYSKFSKSHARAKAIYVAEWTKVMQSPELAPAGSGDYLEDVQFLITEVLKGKRRAGDIVRVRSLVGMGVCGASVLNNPLWLEVRTKSNDLGRPNAASLSKAWLIYEEEAEPFELSTCSRSRPMNHGGEADAVRLRSNGARAAKPMS